MNAARPLGPPLGLRAPSFVIVALAATLLALTFSSAGRAAEPVGAWRVSHGEDRITRMKALLATSPSTRAKDLMGNPLRAPDGWIGFFCHEGKEGAFLAFFQAPNLAPGLGEGRTKRWTIRTRWDEKVHSLALLSTSDGTIFAFEDVSEVVSILSSSSSAVVELPWKEGDPIYFVHAISDARNAIAAARRECAEPAVPREAEVEERASQLALKVVASVAQGGFWSKCLCSGALSGTTMSPAIMMPSLAHNAFAVSVAHVPVRRMRPTNGRDPVSPSFLAPDPCVLVVVVLREDLVRAAGAFPSGSA